MADNKPSFNAGAYLADQGLSFAGLDAGGGPMFRTRDGKDVALDVNAYLKDQGVPVDKVQIEFNSPESARDDSIVSIGDRSKLALGNTKGQLGYLKSKFEGANFVEGKGLVVKDKGVWSKVDSSSMDPWELTKDVVEGAVSFLPSAAAATYGAAQGAAAGAAIGGPAAPVTGVIGGIAGAAAGGGAAEGIRSSLGRLAGTYDATPEEQLKDVGYEALLNAGGQVVAVGAKPALGLLTKAVKSIGKSAAPASKEILIDTIGRTTGAGPVATGIMFDQTDEVVKELGAAGAGRLTTPEVQAALKTAQIQHVENLVTEMPRALTKQYGSLVDDLAKQIPSATEINVGNVIKDSLKELEQAGWGQMINPANTSKQPLFELFSNKEALAKVVAGGEGKVFDAETRKSLEEMTGLVNDMLGAGTAKGGNAAKALMDIKKTVNQTARNLSGGSAPPTVLKFVDDFRSAVVNQIGQQFEKAGVKDAYVKTANLYERYASSADLARRIARSENGSESLLNKLVQGAGRNQTYQGLTQDMAELLGERGKSLFNGIMTKEAAKGFAPMLPKSTLGGIALGAAGATGIAVSGAALAPVAAIGAMGVSPRMVLKQVQYGKKMLGFLQGMSPGARTQWLRDPKLVDATIREVVKAPLEEEANKQELLKQAGIGQ